MHTTTTTTKATTTRSRRDVLRHVALAGMSATLWPSGVAAAATKHPNSRARAHVELDVACPGDTFAPDFAGALDAGAGDLRGTTFNVEGLVYPAGTVSPGDGFDPASATATGLWLCQGWFILHPGRGLPHVATTQHYLLGVVSDDRPCPPDQLVSSGVEGGVPETVRAVAGGTGRYRRARGQVRQVVVGTNTTTLRLVDEPAPNFRFRFEP